MTRSPSSRSRSASAPTASLICRSTSPPISATLRVMSCRSTSNALAVWSALVEYSVMVLSLRSAEASRDIVLRTLIVRRSEHFAGRVEFDQLAEIHEGGELRDARRLLHVVGDDHDGVVVGQFVDQLFDLGGGDRVERRARLVEQDHLRPHRDGAGDAQALLLAAGEALAVGVELVLDLVPQRGAAQRDFDAVVDLRLCQLF